MDTQIDEGGFNPFAPGYFDDPYSQFARLRENDPVHVTPLGVLALFRYDDVVKVLHDSRQSVMFEKATPTPMMEAMQESAGDRFQRRNRSMLDLDPPDHTRLRKLVQKAFTPRTIRNLRPRIVELVDEHLDRAQEKDEADLIGDLAFPLPFIVISEMLGMPPGEDRNQLREWSGALVKTLDPILAPEELDAAEEAADKMFAYISDVIAYKRENPADDMLTALIQAEEEGDVLDDEELSAQVGLLYIAGHETTVNLIGNGALALLRNPDERERLRSDESLDGSAVEEFLRYDPPVQFSRRIVVEPVELSDGTTLEPGTVAMVGLASANRDPEFFGEDADRLRLDREEAAKHASFGGGVHYCLGAALARLEGQVALGAFVRRFPDAELTVEDLRWNGRINLRGLEELPVALNA